MEKVIFLSLLLFIVVGAVQTAPLPHPRMVPVAVGHNATLHCHADSVGSPERVTWDREDGELIQAGKSMAIPAVSQPHIFICRRRNLVTGSMAFATVLVTPQCVRDEAVTAPGYLPSLHLCLRPGQRLSLVCSSSAPDLVSVEWTGPENTPVGSGNLLTRTVRGAEFGKYECAGTDERGRVWKRQVEVMEAGASRDVMLNDAGSSSLTGSTRLAFVLHPETDRVVNVAVGSQVVLKCPLDQLRGEHRHVRWTFNGSPRNATLTRLSVSELVIPRAGVEDIGQYRCQIREKLKKIVLFVKKTDPKLHVFPSSLKRRLKPDSRQEAEIHCLAQGYDFDASNVEWRFLPPGGESYQALPRGVKVQTDGTRINSFLLFSPLRLEHAGTYRCRLPARPVLGAHHSKLILEAARPEVVTRAPTGEPRPEERLIISPPSGVLSACVNKTSVSALCWVESQRFTPRWRNKRTGLIDGRKETLEMLSGRRLRLQLQDFSFADDGEQFECFSDSISPALWRTVTLRVTEECDYCQCSPNQLPCEIHNKTAPAVSCINANWRCDGEDDCGNGYDERGCDSRVNNKDLCNSTHFTCRDGMSIPKGFWCDGEPDCEGGEDERSCGRPTFTLPTVVNRPGFDMGGYGALRCIARGVPPPVIVWRFNWDCLPPDILTYCRCKQKADFFEMNCDIQVRGYGPQHFGIVTCEALNSVGRSMSEDFILGPTKPW